MAFYNPPKNGTTARAVSLDLVLRTLMNSTDFHVSSTRMWDSISKMVPGTTPQQCARRWDELLLSSPSSVAGDLSGLSATGRPISGQERKTPVRRSRSSSSQLSTERLTDSSWSADTLRIDRIDEGKTRPFSSSHIKKSLSFQGMSGFWDYSMKVSSKDQDLRKGSSQVGFDVQNSVPAKSKIKGSFATSFCQTVLRRPKDEKGMVFSDSELPSEEEKYDEVKSKKWDSVTKEEVKIIHDVTIKVSDESKKTHRKFHCARDILLQEMPYFQKYLNEKLSDAEISVHCDINIFEWLISYVKKRTSIGLGQKDCDLRSLKLVPSQSISILISSYFLQMDKLVEESLNYCHKNMTEVLETNSNLNCISRPLMTRLAAKFSPTEAEYIKDKNDRIKSKLFIHQLELLFNPDYSSPECPSNASSLYLCKYCNQLLTPSQEFNLPCTEERLSVNVFGKIIYKHERSLMWNVNSYIRSLQQSEGLTPRDLYWRLWGVINMLYCDKCHSHFQCWDLKGCRYHPNSSQINIATECSCSRNTGFVILPQQKEGCCCREHQVLVNTSDNSRCVYSIVTHLRDVVCKPPISSCYQQQQQQTQQQPYHGYSATATPGFTSIRTKSMDTALTGLLQTQQKRSISSNIGLSKKRESATSELRAVYATSEYVSASCGPSIAASRQQQQVQGPQESSELEEDEEESKKTSHCAATVASNKSKKKSTKRHKHNSSEWVWNSTRTKTWNQDMQRENDEKRQTALLTQLSQISSVGSNAASKSDAQVNYAGGIYQRLEGQFRTQHTAKTMAMQSKPFAGKKRT